MHITLSLNREYPAFVQGAPTRGHYGSSQRIMEELEARGVIPTFVNPTGLSVRNGTVYADVLHLASNGKIRTIGENVPLETDVFLVRSLGEDEASHAVYPFLDALAALEHTGQANAIINDASSTSYELKHHQKRLDLPFIPAHTPHTLQDLEELVETTPIIAKPHVGFLGAGVEYLDTPDTARLFASQHPINAYVFETYVPDMIERRFIFLDDTIIARRILERTGMPGREDFGEQYVATTPTPDEDRIVRSAREQTGMVFGCVDFRGPYVLEVNGSGTTTAAKNLRGEHIYDHTGLLAEYLIGAGS